MAVKKNKRKYNFSDAYLAERKDSLQISLTRDLAVLTEYGLTSGKITALNGLRAAFEAVLPDEIYMGQMMLARGDRDDAKAALYTALDSLRSKVESIWPNNAEDRKKAYGLSGGLRELNAVEMLAKAKAVKLTVAAHLADFPAAYNVDAGAMTALQNLINDLDTKNTAYDGALITRKSKTDERISTGNALYDGMMLLANIGKNYWENRNATTFEEYVITNNPAPPAPAQDFVFTTVGGNVSTLVAPLNLTNADNSLTLTNQNTGVGEDIEYWCAASELDPVPMETITLTSGSTETHIAGDFGYDTVNNKLISRVAGGAPVTVRYVVAG